MVILEMGLTVLAVGAPASNNTAQYPHSSSLCSQKDCLFRPLFDYRIEKLFRIYRYYHDYLVIPNYILRI